MKIKLISLLCAHFSPSLSLLLPLSPCWPTMFAPFSHIKQEINTCASRADSIWCIWPIRFVGAQLQAARGPRCNLLQRMGNIVCAAPDKARKKRSKQAILLFSGDRKMATNRTGQVWVTLPRDAVRQRKSSINRMAEQAAKYLITLVSRAVRSSLWGGGY